MVSFEENIGLVHTQAKLGFRWAQGAGLSLDYEDMFQEASVAFLLAAQGFDPESGLKFSTYYHKAAFSQFRKTIGTMSGVKNLNLTQREEIAARKEENARRRANAQPELPDMNYGLCPVMFSHMGAVGQEDVPNFEESLEGDGMSPEQLFEFKQTWEIATSNLSPLAALIIDWLRDPPAELLRELKCQMVHADERNAAGLRSYGLRDGLTIANIGKFLKLVSNVSDCEIATAKAELENVVKKLEAA